MDTITRGFLNDFIERKGYEKISLSSQFEYFCNFCVINKEFDSISFDEKSISTGNSAQGIDGIGIIVNNKLCANTSEIKQIMEMNRMLTVTFVFIQSKSSSKFNNQQIENFCRWTKNFFSEEATLFSTDEMKNFIEMREFIYSNSRYMKERNPNCNLYFCTSGKWEEDANLVSILESNKKEIENLDLFDNVQISPIDSKSLQNLYRKTKEPVEATIKFERKVDIPTINEITVAYSGLLPFSEFKKIIIDETGKMKSVFDDNIRDYLEQENNAVNKDISNTIQRGGLEQFCILNNGVTIVAEEITGPGVTITLSNYQIVNGCQTSNVLYENRGIDGIDEMHIPVKIIVTTNHQIKSEITRATNNQTAVDAVELEALSEFQRNLEDYYNSLPKDEYKLYYERRTNQYKSADDIPLYRIINRESQIKSLSSMFLNNPHNVAGNYGRLVDKIGDEIFNPDHDYFAYYISALSYYKLERLINENKLLTHSKRFRYHILTVFRFLITKVIKPNLKDSGRIKRIGNQILDVLKDNDKTFEYFLESAKFIESDTLDIDFKDRKAVERKNTTDLIIDKLTDLYLKEK
ncbi:AIPR family protein [Corallibacter sp.]|uniref:AIPR family protein n=1 Tax=Corallibacter sp. TaxID=2038084 RepID=UPI003A94EE43